MAEARQGRRRAASLDAGEHSAHAGTSAGPEPTFREQEQLACDGGGPQERDGLRLAARRHSSQFFVSTTFPSKPI